MVSQNHHDVGMTTPAQGVMGQIEVHEDVIIKRLKQKGNPKHRNTLLNELRIFKELYKKKTPVKQGWVPKKMEWDASKNELKMQRLGSSVSTISHHFFSTTSLSRPTKEDKEVLRTVIQHAFRDLQRFHRIAIHMDLHTDNGMFRKTRDKKGKEHVQFVLIDFGMTLLLSDLKQYFSNSIIALLKKMETRHLYTLFQYAFPEKWQQSILRSFLPSIPVLSEKEEMMYDDIHDFCILLIEQGRFL